MARRLDAGLELLDRQVVDVDGNLVGKVVDLAFREADDGGPRCSSRSCSARRHLVPGSAADSAGGGRPALAGCPGDPTRWLFRLSESSTSARPSGSSYASTSCPTPNAWSAGCGTTWSPGCLEAAMRAADLLDVDVVDEQDRHLGKVRDLRLVSSGDGGPWRLEGLILGLSGIGYRLGYASGQVHGPAVLAALARLLCRRARYLPWTRVAGWNGQQLIVCGAGSDLPGPPEAEP